MACIKLEGVSKCYRVHGSPLQSLVGLVAPKMVVPQEVWALRAIQLEVQPGECVGIIGNNGSGKSTLLGVVGGIISPTEGTVEVEGRLSTLLDLTVGMQRELSGRENVGIIGGLLGLTGAQIQERAGSIMDFAGLGDAIDRPVKTYSTGMTMRLGFSIALHAEFDIFLVDEVLAVGDNNFHRRCIRRMRELHADEGKTILIASHGLGEVSALTSRLVLLKEGRILREGRTEEVLAAYWRECEVERSRVGHRVSPMKPVNPYGEDSGDVKIERVRFLDRDEQERGGFATAEPLTVEIWFNARHPVDNPLFRVQIFRNDGVWVHGMNSYRHDCNLGRIEGRGCMRLEYEVVNLLEGDYFVSVGVWPDEYTSFISDVAYDLHERAYVFRVHSERVQGAGIVTQPAFWRFYPPGEEQTLELERAANASGEAGDGAGE
jgi:ABC-type polysaccharide/polyol phosphate transport system ATPase subunit